MWGGVVSVPSNCANLVHFPGWKRCEVGAFKHRHLFGLVWRRFSLPAPRVWLYWLVPGLLVCSDQSSSLCLLLKVYLSVSSHEVNQLCANVAFRSFGLIAATTERWRLCFLLIVIWLFWSFTQLRSFLPGSLGLQMQNTNGWFLHWCDQKEIDGAEIERFVEHSVTGQLYLRW